MVLEVRAHCEKRGYRTELGIEIAFGNFVCDQLAEEAAGDVSVSFDAVKRISEVDIMAKSISHRSCFEG